MRKPYRIVLALFIGLLGACTLIVFLADLIYRILYLNLKSLDQLSIGEIFLYVLLFLITLTTIPSLIFHIRIIKSVKIDWEGEPAKQIKFKLSKVIWTGNFLFGIGSIILGIQILQVTISMQLMPLAERYRAYGSDVKYFNYLIATIIVIIGLKVIMDVRQINKTA